VWRVAAVTAVALLAVVVGYMLAPRSYYTGTNSVEALTYVVPSEGGRQMCVPGLEVPPATARIRLSVVSLHRVRPMLRATVVLPGQTVRRTLPAVDVGPARVSNVDLAIATTPPTPPYRPATVCVTAAGLVNWAGTPLVSPPQPAPPTLDGRPFSARVAVWYLPRPGAEQSFLSRASTILHRASLFRPGFVGPWLYYLILLVVLPGLWLVAVRSLALAVTLGAGPRRAAAVVFAAAFVNFACWALITPSFQAPDEVDHFAYTQSLAERGEAPSTNPASALARWSASENLLLYDSSFFTDHQVGDTRLPWLTAQERAYEGDVQRERPSRSNGGGNETAATHGPLYYATLVPAYFAGGSGPSGQLTAMRLLSALLGALVPLFTFLLARELAPGRRWPAVLAALLVAFEPMFGFISGAVNNDVGINAGAAALELMLIRVLRRGIDVRSGLVLGALLAALPQVKGTIISLYPVAAVALAATIWRHHLPAMRQRAGGWWTRARALTGIAALVAVGLGVRQVALHITAAFAGERTEVVGRTAGSINAGRVALEHPLSYLSYLWQVFLPRLPHMSPHFEGTGWPAFVIFVERGWGAFGWYDVLYPRWVFVVIACVMGLIGVLGLLALRRHWAFVRAHALEAVLLVAMPLAVVAGVEAAFYSGGLRTFLPEFGRYAFPAIAPLAVLVVAALHGLRQRLALYAGTALLVATLMLSYAGMLLTLTRFYA
jgi:hypothetical protein